ncbi:MAG TPA: ASPIC/UnbV domain-containing protein, partial [Micropepsaceae bacterium]|nr:ASPIC/UnbV domain-containing protein [Micropepsaceae bacterium]
GHPGIDLHGRSAICAQARVVLPNGRKLVGQVDGGSGHSGRRSPDVHLGLGKVNPATKLDVEVKWRDTAGQAQQTTLKLAPGWHTVVLGNVDSTKLAAVTEGTTP